MKPHELVAVTFTVAFAVGALCGWLWTRDCERIRAARIARSFRNADWHRTTRTVCEAIAIAIAGHPRAWDSGAWPDPDPSRRRTPMGAYYDREETDLG